MSKVTKGTVVFNLIWRYAERTGAQLVQLIVTIVLARILTPEIYGSVALVTVFITILNVFIDSGMGNALIQKKDADDLDFSTVFYFNLTVCIQLYLLLFYFSPMIADFYDKPALTPAVIRVLGLTLLISGVKNIQQAYVSRTLQFKRFFFATLGGTIGAGILGVSMADLGLGIWALVGQYLFNAAVDTLILWITVKWRPRPLFSLQRLWRLFRYGWKLLASALLDTVYNNVRQLIIGKLYSAADLGYYNNGKKFPNIVITNINTSINSVLFPVISSAQDDRERVKSMTRRAIRTSSFIIWPIVMGMAACAEPIIRILLTDKWLPSVPFLQLFCITYGFWPVHTANLSAIKAVGRSDIFLGLEIIKKIIGFISILISIPFGPIGIAFVFMLTSPLSAVLNAVPNVKLLGYRYREQLADMAPSMLLSFFMAGAVYCMNRIPLNIFLLLGLQILAGVVLYVLGAKVLHFESFQYLTAILNKRLGKKKAGAEKGTGVSRK